ncbi:hypothetical protein [Meiothermus sp. CFH 77666]|nr:hypothetical protein [Meiothermus sp. CFH 77666]
MNLERRPDAAKGHTCMHLLAVVLLERGEKRRLVRTLAAKAA